MKLKKKISIILLIFLIFPFLTPFFQNKANANIQVRFNDGVLYFETRTTAASTGTRYKTIGWQVHTEHANGNPTTMDRGIMMPLIQTAQNPDPPIPGQQVTTSFEIPVDKVHQAIRDAKMSSIKDGDTVYLSAIMTVTENGVEVGPTCYTLQCIKTARAWSNPGDLDQYFDNPVAWSSPDYPVSAIIQRDDTGFVISSTSKGSFKSGTAVSHEFDRSIEVNGKTFVIERSYITPTYDYNDRRYEVDKNHPSVLTRNVGVLVEGLRIVGSYRECTQNDSDPNCGLQPPPAPDPTPSGGTCSPSDSGPRRGSILSGQDMTANATGEIKADNRDNKRFDVGLGIPTSESLYANTFAKNYLFKNQSVNMTGEVDYTVTVKKTYNLTWTEEEEGPPDEDGNPTTIQVPKSDTEVVEQQYTVNRQYDYWLIDNFEVYKINRASMSNYSLPGGNVTLNPNNYSPPTVTATNDDTHSSHLQYAQCQDVVDLGSENIDGGGSRPSAPSKNWQSEAEAVVGENQVRNDHVVFNNATIMNNNWTSQSAPTPSSIPYPAMIGRDTLYRSGLMIDSSKSNRANTSSSGTIYYDLLKGIKGGSAKQFPINSINAVTVHTPVVNYAQVSNDAAHNQKTVPTANRSALILERPFSVRVPTSGQHTNYLGYGNRDYVKYVRQKQVWFPFDVYTGDKKTYIPARTWINLNVNQLDTTFFMPVWVDEGNYDVLFRTISENAPGSFTSQPDANINLAHHVATQTVPVQVVGRLYDFRITDIADFNWEEVFRITKGKPNHTGNYYWVGQNGIDGSSRGNGSKFTLPIRLGSHTHPGYKNVGVKTGYHFKFDFKTKGNMFGQNDKIRITPKFYFVKKDGSGRIEVDLYYHSNEKYFIKIGSKDDKLTRSVVLDERLRNVPDQQLQDTATFYYNNYYSGTVSFNEYLKQFLIAASKKTNVGKPNLMMLNEQVRTFIGPKNVPSGVDPLRANASVQQWYGEYSLPAAPYVVLKDYDIFDWGRRNNGLTDKSPIFLKDGYIIVNFNIETIRNNNVNNPHLQYINGPLNNQWQMEGFNRRITDPYGNTFNLIDGDIIFYHADASSYDDFQVRVTH